MSDEEKKYPLFELRMREGATGLMTGANTELLMDGKKLGTVTNVKIEVGARSMAKITLEMYGRFHAVGTYDPAGVEQVYKHLPEVKDDQSQE